LITTLALAVISLVTVRLVSVPTVVRLEEVTDEFIVAPVNVPAAAGTVIFVLPLKFTPFIDLAVCSTVAVVAFPVIVPVTVILLKLGDTTGCTSHVTPFHFHVSAPTASVSFTAGLLGKLMAICYPIIRIYWLYRSKVLD
jgi:hypothetical protein